MSEKNTGETRTGAAGDRPRVGTSACLLGSPVRYDGQSQRQPWLTETLAQWVVLVPFCPEMEMGLGAPREVMHLETDPGSGEITLKTTRTRRDLTALVRATSARLALRTEALDGFVFKKSSPSCGVENVKVFRGDAPERPPNRVGSGFFAAEVLRQRPWLPVIEEPQLEDSVQAERFVIRVFAHHALRQLPARVTEIQRFHRQYEVMLTAVSPESYQALNEIAANSERHPPSQVREAYGREFLRALALPDTVPRRVNVLQRLFGYLKTHLNPDQKRHVSELIERYGEKRVPFQAPLALLEDLIHRFGGDNLKDQRFLSPGPRAMGLGRYR